LSFGRSYSRDHAELASGYPSLAEGGQRVPGPDGRLDRPCGREDGGRLAGENRGDGSPTGRPGGRTVLRAGPNWLRPVLAEIFASKWSQDELPDFSGLQDAFVFHMADVIEDLGRLEALLRSQEKPDQEHLASVLRRFFLHAVPHLVAAGQL